jgi:hypothetical protein
VSQCVACSVPQHDPRGNPTNRTSLCGHIRLTARRAHAFGAAHRSKAERTAPVHAIQNMKGLKCTAPMTLMPLHHSCMHHGAEKKLTRDVIVNTYHCCDASRMARFCTEFPSGLSFDDAKRLTCGFSRHCTAAPAHADLNAFTMQCYGGRLDPTVRSAHASLRARAICCFAVQSMGSIERRERVQRSWCSPHPHTVPNAPLGRTWQMSSAECRRPVDTRRTSYLSATFFDTAWNPNVDAAVRVCTA